MAILAAWLGCEIKNDLRKKDGEALLDTAVTTRVPKAPRNPARETNRLPGSPSLRRDIGEDFAPRRRSIAPATNLLHDDDEADFTPRRRLGGLRLRLSAGIPRSMVGRVLAGCAIFGALAATIVGMWAVRSLLLSNPRLVIPSSSAIQITGNNHLSRAQLLTVFGEDVDRNILTVPLALRRAELENLPWVEHATVMRLLPNHFRVAIDERTPVAFVRQGSAIGLVDAHGVLLDLATGSDSDNGDTPAQTHYSFPVVTGISARDPFSVRAARMAIFTRFTGDLGEQTKNISEVDLSSPEDVKALIPDGTSDILVHFGDDNFLRRYDLYQKNLPGWRKEFPKLASADMRYERQVVLEMQPGAGVPVAGDAAAPDAPKLAAAPVKPATKPVAKAVSKPETKRVAKAIKPRVVAKPAAKKPTKPVPVASAGAQHLQTAFDVPHKSAGKASVVKPVAKPKKAGPQ